MVMTPDGRETPPAGTPMATAQEAERGGELPAEHAADTIALPDGRRLAYLEFGAPQGTPILQMHGLPSCRWEAALAGAAARARGVRLICPDRPGLGGSDPLPGRTIAAWPGDLAALADALGLERFSVVGVSGGTPYALACALAFPERIQRVAIVSGLCPWPPVQGKPAVGGAIRTLAALARKGGVVPRGISGMLAGWVRWAPGPYFALAWYTMLNAADRAALARPGDRTIFRRMGMGAFAQGGAGAALEARLLFSDWALALARLRQPVAIWHGGADSVVPPAMAEALARALPGADFRLAAGEGHFSVAVRRADEILNFLLG